MVDLIGIKARVKGLHSLLSIYLIIKETVTVQWYND